MKTAFTAEERRHLAWETALDRLELDVLVCGRLSGGTEEGPRLHDWDLPDDLGPIPDDLLPRAREIAARQVAASEQLAGAMVALRRRQEELAAGGGTYAGGARAAYVDTHA